MGGEILIGMIGVAMGLLGAFAGIGTMVWGMGYFEYLGGKKRSPIFPLSKAELKQKLLALNSVESPYEIRPAEETDLMMEWKIVDARWLALFARERLSKIYRAFIVLDEGRRAARYYEELGTVQWFVGSHGVSPPRISYQNQFFKGRILFHKSWGIHYGVKKNMILGKIYEYKFDIGYVRDPIRKATIESGWEFVTVVRKAHATYNNIKH